MLLHLMRVLVYIGLSADLQALQSTSQRINLSALPLRAIENLHHGKSET
jgi:hypothetical protein